MPVDYSGPITPAWVQRMREANQSPALIAWGELRVALDLPFIERGLILHEDAHRLIETAPGQRKRWELISHLQHEHLHVFPGSASRSELTRRHDVYHGRG